MNEFIQVYMYGNSMVWASLGSIIGLYIVTSTFLPKLYELKLYSIFTYIEMRYESPLITNITLVVGLGSAFFHLIALSFLTALAFSTLINIPIWVNLVILNSIATIYTLCGGMKASKVFENSPGLTGLLISAAYSATLSTLSTGLNSFATVVFKVNYKFVLFEKIYLYFFRP